GITADAWVGFCARGVGQDVERVGPANSPECEQHSRTKFRKLRASGSTQFGQRFAPGTCAGTVGLIFGGLRLAPLVFSVVRFGAIISGSLALAPTSLSPITVFTCALGRTRH